MTWKCDFPGCDAIWDTWEGPCQKCGWTTAAPNPPPPHANCTDPRCPYCNLEVIE